MRNLISANIEVGNLEGIGPLGTNLIGSPTEAPTRFGAYLNVFMQILIIGAGLYTLFNFIIAGYLYISSGSDPKKIQDATAKIYQSVIGLVLVAGSFLLAALIGFLVFKDPDALLMPVIK